MLGGMNPARPRQNILQLLAPAIEHLRVSGRVRLRGASKNARPWLAAVLSRLSDRPIVWIVENEQYAEDACRAARFFLGASDPDPADPFAHKIQHLPLHQTHPYDEVSPDRFVLAERLSVFFRLLHASPPDLLVCSVPALMRLTLPRTALDTASQLIVAGQELDRKDLAARLVQSGYLQVPLVEDPGSFAIRGGIIDVYTPLLPLPVRLELLGDEVESIRSFDPQTQRTVARLDGIFLGPVREILQDGESRQRALEAVSRVADELDLPSHRLVPFKRSLREGVWFFGIESLLPAFYPSLESVFDYLGGKARVLVDDAGAVFSAAEQVWQRAVAAHQESTSAGNLAFSPASMLLTPEELRGKIDGLQQVVLGLSEEHLPQVDLACEDVPGLRERIGQGQYAGDPFAPTAELLDRWRKAGVFPVITASRPARARELAGMLRRRKIPARIESRSFDPAWAESRRDPDHVLVVAGDLSGGFACLDAGAGFLPDAEVFGRPVRRERSARAGVRLAALKQEGLVVHVDFGIGRFAGLTKLEVAGSEGDYLLLKYRGGDRLYLPVTRMNLIERYLGPEGSRPPLSKLGGKGWDRIKKKVHQELLEIANQLICLHAARRARPGMAAASPGEDFRSLEASFVYEETEDQQRAIQEVIDDLTSKRAMDRLVCGDVGFGKTEVAVRAAYLQALSGRQTAVLVPTTVLGLQHLETFRARLDSKAVRIEMLSRLVKPARQKSVLEDLADGRVDVVIGTHRLLGKDVRFKSLGLVIIDEEHRFGVRHKENLKAMKESVDVLAMTATPLPRTLQLSLTGLRDISVIRTPPPGRRSIRTLISRFSSRVIEEAIHRELSRGGQVFFLHNWVRSLPAMERYLQRILPGVRTGRAHGKMGERPLEQVMTDFIRREIDVLVCTSIIESGLDIPSANTIIVNRADLFGLSQLYQIRGRVGRASERAYAYLMIPGLSSVTPDARKRLEALSDFSELGSGYRIAAQDLEIRGAGNLLGKAQSGHIAAVGFELYSRLLERAVMECRGQADSTGPEPEMSLPVAGYLPDDYVTDVDQRLDIYARLSRAPTEDEVFEVEREIVDRFGPEPEEVKNLCEMMALKTQLRLAHFLAIDIKGDTLNLKIDPTHPPDPGGLVRLAREQSERVSIDKEGSLCVRLTPDERRELLPTVRMLIARLVS
jgi:transcription-repair coupling factor (superfamily II helicase)